ELQTEVQIARVFVDKCIELLMVDKLDTATASMAKYWCSDLQCKVIDECVQLHVGYGYMWECPMARAFADARVQRIYGGPDEIMKEVISRSMGLRGRCSGSAARGPGVCVKRAGPPEGGPARTHPMPASGRRVQSAFTYSDTTFQRPSWICDIRDRLLPSRFFGPNVISALPNMSVGITIVSMALMNESVFRFWPALDAARMNASTAR